MKRINVMPQACTNCKFHPMPPVEPLLNNPPERSLYATSREQSQKQSIRNANIVPWLGGPASIWRCQNADLIGSWRRIFGHRQHCFEEFGSISWF